jgi:hypothetical protein
LEYGKQDIRMMNVKRGLAGKNYGWEQRKIAKGRDIGLENMSDLV